MTPGIKKNQIMLCKAWGLGFFFSYIWANVFPIQALKISQWQVFQFVWKIINSTGNINNEPETQLEEQGIGGGGGVGGCGGVWQEKCILVLAVALVLCSWESPLISPGLNFWIWKINELSKVLNKVPSSSRILIVYLGLSFISPKHA